MNEQNPYAPPQADSPWAAPDADHHELATRSARLGAAMIDGLIMMAILLPIMYITGYWDRAMLASQANSGFGKGFNPEQLLFAAGGIVLWLALNWSLLQQGQTIGKRAVGIRIVAKDGQRMDAKRIFTHRFLPVQVVTQIPGIGSILAFVDCLLIFRKDQNTLHDDIAGTKVVTVAPAGSPGRR